MICSSLSPTSAVTSFLSLLQTHQFCSTKSIDTFVGCIFLRISCGGILQQPSLCSLPPHFYRCCSANPDAAMQSQQCSSANSTLLQCKGHIAAVQSQQSQHLTVTIAYELGSGA
jgi:tRNA G26 N,N-dimethylase Trm1